MNKGLKNKGLGSWFCLAAALVALITGIVFLLTQATAAPLGHSGTMAGVVLLVGAAASLVFFFVSVPFSALIQAVIYNIALYLVVVQLYFVFADVINHVTFAGGNAGLCVFYMVGTFVACLLSVIACFCKQTKTGEAKATGKQFAAAGAVVAVAAVCVGGFSLQSSSLPSNGDAEVAPDAAQTSAEGPVMNYNDNEFVSKTLDDLVSIPQETWEAKEPNGEVAYFFEGQYTEGFSTIVDPACLDMYCYTDGSMWGSFSGPSTSVGGDSISHVYGYWYNYDENGEKNFVIHLLGNQDADGTVTGVFAQKTGSEKYIKINAKAVIIATGDYLGNEDMMKFYAPQCVENGVQILSLDMDSAGNYTNIGEGHKMGAWAGAHIEQWHAPVIHHMGGGAGPDGRGVIGNNGYLWLNLRGKRFMNEDIPGQQLENQVELQPERKAYQFFDASWPEQLKYFPAAHGVACFYREEELPEYTASGLRINVRTQKDIDDAVADGRCLKADTIDELLSKIEGIDVDEAKKSIERYNELCAKGCDDDFGVAGSDMAAIDTPPFFCIKGDVGMSGINAGVMVDNRYRVIDTEGAPIPGLYAAGIQAGNPCGGINWSMPGGFSNSHIFTAGRYTVIHALTGDMTPKNPSGFDDLKEYFAGEDGSYMWESPDCATAISVW